MNAIKMLVEFGYNKAKVEVEDSYRETLCNTELNLARVTQQLEELEKDKCELLGLIQEKDKLIEKMKSCGNCRWCSNHCCIESFENPISYRGCENYSKWELAEN